MKATASLAISSIVFGVAPPEAPTPRLPKAMTRCLAAMPSTTRGSQLSRTAAKVGEEDHRHPGARAELTVGELHAAGVDRVRRRALPRRVRRRTRGCLDRRHGSLLVRVAWALVLRSYYNRMGIMQ